MRKRLKKQLGNRKSDSLMKSAVYLLPCRIDDLKKKKDNNLNNIGLKCPQSATVLGDARNGLAGVGSMLSL